MVTKTNVYVVFENNSYTIDNTVGYIPAVLLEDNEFKALFVIPKAMQFDFKEKKIEWQVEQFVWNKLTEKWIAFESDLFMTNANGLPRLLVDSNSMVNAQGQVVLENFVMSEIDYYIASLGKQAIFPALQEAIKQKV